MKKKDMLWRRVIVAKFNIDERRWFTRGPSRPHGKGWWKRSKWVEVYFKCASSRRLTREIELNCGRIYS